MPAQPTSTGGKYVPTDTSGIYRRDARYILRWAENGKRVWRSFPTYEGACAFKRDYVIPHRENRGLPPTSIAPGRRKNGWVYAFQSRGEGELVKVGYSVDPATRMRDLVHASPYDLDLMLLVPGSMAIEKRLHAKLSEFRMRGEWYSREVLDMIPALLWEGLGRD